MARKLLFISDYALLWCNTASLVGRFQDGWLRVIWKWNKSLCLGIRDYGGVDWKKHQHVLLKLGGIRKKKEGGGGGGAGGCVLEVPEGCSC